MNQLFLYWLMGALLMLIFEIGSPGLFVFLSFSVGACGGALAAYAGTAFFGQCAVALIVSVVTFLAMSFWITKTFTRHQERHKTNVDALIGKKGFVIVTIESHTFGQVKIMGQAWSARSVRSDVIQQGEYIVVLEVRGSHLVVDRATR